MTATRARIDIRLGMLGMILLMICAATLRSDDKTPTTPPTTGPQSDTTKVKRGSIDLTVSAAGAFVPVDPFTVRLRFKAYQGDLIIASAVAPGTTVAKDEVILQLDDTQYKRQLAMAQAEQTVALANFEKAQSDVTLGEASDALAMKMQEDEVKHADEGLKWWENVDGAQMLQDADLQVKYSKDSVNDQQDELDQLKKMYKSEELTNATADIVVKRALRAMENAQVRLKMTEARTEKTKVQEYPIYHTRVQDGVTQHHQALDQLKAQQAQTKIARQSALTGAKVGQEAANERLANLKEDANQFAWRASQSMTVYYGDLVNGSWQNNSEELFRPGEKLVLPPQHPYSVPGAQMTGTVSNKLRFVAEVPEDKIVLVQKGQTVTLTPNAMPQTRADATVASIAPVTDGGGNYEVSLAVAGDSAGVRPGMRGSFKSPPIHIDNILLLPASAVSNGKVSLKQPDGTEKSVEVQTGRSDGESIEIVSGVKEGDEVLTQAKK